MAPGLPLSGTSRLVVLGNLELGDGGSEDKASPVSEILLSALSMYYLDSGYTFILAGDSEDLSRFWRRDVKSAWSRVHGIFDEFARQGRLVQILGDRDLGLIRKTE